MPPARCCASPTPRRTPLAATGQVIVDAILPTRENLIGRLERLSERVDELAETAKVEGRDGVALAGLSEIRKTISDIGRIAGLDRPPSPSRSTTTSPPLPTTSPARCSTCFGRNCRPSSR